MPLTAAEKLQRRQTDPYFGLAEELALPSLAQQKSVSLAAAMVEKKRDLEPAEALADEALQLDGTSLSDIAESSLRGGYEHLLDFFTGQQRTNEEIQQQADIESGVTPEGRQRLVTDPQQQVVESLAKASLALGEGELLEAGKQGLTAAGQSILAAPGTLAESAQIIPELAIGALGTAVGGRALLGRRAKKAKEGAGKLFDRVSEERANLAKIADESTNIGVEAIKGIPKAAGQVSLATVDITQRQINEFRELHGVDPTREEAATMYAINMATMLPTPSIIKNLFIPDFKKQLKTEVKTLTKNIKGGSNFKNIMGRVLDGTKKVTAAGGAEAGQEYFQTWAEAINVQLGPKERENFWQSIKDVIGKDENQLQALVGAFLGGGAGAGARAAITVPAVAAGTTIDTAKGTAKLAGEAVVGTAKGVSRATQKIADKASYKVLSQEERDIIRGEYESRKELVDAKTQQFESSIEKVKAATTPEQLREDPEIAKIVAKRQEEAGFTDTDLDKRRNLERLKADVIRSYRGDIGLLKTELATSTVAAVGTKAAQNIGEKSVEVAREAVRAVAPGVEAVVETVKQYGDQAVKAVRELRSSTALGMIELAANAGKAETKQIIEASKSLSLDDLQRTAAVISEFKPEIARQLQTVIRNKEKALQRAGFKRDTIINEETLDPVVTDVANRGKVSTGEVAAVSTAVNATVAGKISDMVALETVEKAVAAIEASPEFKSQTKGAMSRAGMAAVKAKLARARTRLEKEPTVADKVVKEATKAAKKVAEKAAPVVKKAGEKAAAAVAPKVEVSGTFQAVIDGVTKSLKDPKQAPVLVQAAPNFVKQMKRYGVKTRSDFLAFIEQFPELADNIEFFSAIEAEFPSDISAKEVYDNVRTKAVSTAEAIKKAYNDMNPPECKV